MTLTRRLGGEWRGHSGNAPCPVCQPERRADQRALSLCDHDGRLLLYCHKSGCDYAEILGAADVRTTVGSDPFGDAVCKTRMADAERRHRRIARRLWDESRPIDGSPGAAYFRSRGITLDLPSTLRWLDWTLHTSGRLLSAIIAVVELTGGVHRTFFEPDGARLSSAAKLMLGPCRGGAVRLAGGPGALLVGEGIESTLSAMQLLQRTEVSAWAALSTSGMKTLVLPPDPRELIIACDSGAAVRDAAMGLADRAAANGWQVSIADPGGHDWNDVLMARRVAA